MMKRRWALLMALAVLGMTGCSPQGAQPTATPLVITAADATAAPELDEPGEPAAPSDAPSPTPEVVYEAYTGEVPHIFIHCLIAYPEVKQGGQMPYASECITVTEFNRMLEQLWQNGYSLVDLHDTFARDAQGKLVFAQSVQVPQGRKPVILSVDDVVYDYRKRGNGMVDGLVIDENDEVSAVTYRADGTPVYSRDNEFLPILEDFIAEHPAFSSNGARATLCMTGFAGLFGFRSEEGYEGDRDAEIAKAQQMADRLKQMGYTFANHGYGHRDVTKQTVESMRTDLEKTKNEVETILGKLSVYVYPYGKLIYPDDERYHVAQQYGYELFCSVSHFFYRREYEAGDSLYMTRVAIDGYSLTNYKTVLAPLMDVDQVIDRENRP